MLSKRDSTEKSTWDDPSSLKEKMGRIPDTLKSTVPYTSNSSSDTRRKIFVIRHGERTDLVFGKYVPYSFDDEGNYIRKDLNMPRSFPPRENLQHWHNDTPLTNVGLFQANLIGDSMKDCGEKIDIAFCSPMYRCVQTCHALLQGLGVLEKVKICIEPGLMEYTAFYPDHIPEVYTPEELLNLGFNVDTEYQPLTSTQELRASADETFIEFYHRNANVTQRIIQNYSGNALISAHGSNLDTNTRFAIGGEMRTTKEMSETLANVGFCALVVIAQNDNGWAFTEPPLSQLSHAPNSRFDYRIFSDNT